MSDINKEVEIVVRAKDETGKDVEKILTKIESSKPADLKLKLDTSDVTDKIIELTKFIQERIGKSFAKVSNNISSSLDDSIKFESFEKSAVQLESLLNRLANTVKMFRTNKPGQNIFGFNVNVVGNVDRSLTDVKNTLDAIKNSIESIATKASLTGKRTISELNDIIKSTKKETNVLQEQLEGVVSNRNFARSKNSKLKLDNFFSIKSLKDEAKTLGDQVIQQFFQDKYITVKDKEKFVRSLSRIYAQGAEEIEKYSLEIQGEIYSLDKVVSTMLNHKKFSDLNPNFGGEYVKGLAEARLKIVDTNKELERTKELAGKDFNVGFDDDSLKKLEDIIKQLNVSIGEDTQLGFKEEDINKIVDAFNDLKAVLEGIRSGLQETFKNADFSKADTQIEEITTDLQKTEIEAKEAKNVIEDIGKPVDAEPTAGVREDIKETISQAEILKMALEDIYLTIKENEPEDAFKIDTKKYRKRWNKDTLQSEYSPKMLGEAYQSYINKNISFDALASVYSKVRKDDKVIQTIFKDNLKLLDEVKKRAKEVSDVLGRLYPDDYYKKQYDFANLYNLQIDDERDPLGLTFGKIKDIVDEKGLEEASQYLLKLSKIQDEYFEFAHSDVGMRVKHSYGSGKELRQEYGQLLPQIKDGSITASEAIDKLEQKIKELGYTYDENLDRSKRWVKNTPKIDLYDTLHKAFEAMDTDQMSGKQLFDWVQTNCSDADKAILNITEDYKEFQALLRGANVNYSGLFSYSDSLDMDSATDMKKRDDDYKAELKAKEQARQDAVEKTSNALQEEKEQVEKTTEAYNELNQKRKSVFSGQGQDDFNYADWIQKEIEDAIEAQQKLNQEKKESANIPIDTEPQEQIKEEIKLEQKLQEKKKETNAIDSDQSSKEVISKESDSLTELKNSVDKVSEAVDEKTLSFQREAGVVSASVNDEIRNLNRLIEKIKEISDSIDALNKNTIKPGVSDDFESKGRKQKGKSTDDKKYEIVPVAKGEVAQYIREQDKYEEEANETADALMNVIKTQRILDDTKVDYSDDIEQTEKYTESVNELSAALFQGKQIAQRIDSRGYITRVYENETGQRATYLSRIARDENGEYLRNPDTGDFYEKQIGWVQNADFKKNQAEAIQRLKEILKLETEIRDENAKEEPNQAILQALQERLDKYEKLFQINKKLAQFYADLSGPLVGNDYSFQQFQDEVDATKSEYKSKQNIVDAKKQAKREEEERKKIEKERQKEQEKDRKRTAKNLVIEKFEEEKKRILEIDDAYKRQLEAYKQYQKVSTDLEKAKTTGNQELVELLEKQKHEQYEIVKGITQEINALGDVEKTEQHINNLRTIHKAGQDNREILQAQANLEHQLGVLNKVEEQTASLKKFLQQVQTADFDTKGFVKRIKELQDRLSKIDDPTALQNWLSDFKILQTEFQTAKNTVKAMQDIGKERKKNAEEAAKAQAKLDAEEQKTRDRKGSLLFGQQLKAQNQYEDRLNKATRAEVNGQKELAQELREQAEVWKIIVDRCQELIDGLGKVNGLSEHLNKMANVRLGGEQTRSQIKAGAVDKQNKQNEADVQKSVKDSFEKAFKAGQEAIGRYKDAQKHLSNMLSGTQDYVNQEEAINNMRQALEKAIEQLRGLEGGSQYADRLTEALKNVDREMQNIADNKASSEVKSLYNEMEKMASGLDKYLGTDPNKEYTDDFKARVRTVQSAINELGNIRLSLNEDDLKGNIEDIIQHIRQLKKDAGDLHNTLAKSTNQTKWADRIAKSLEKNTAYSEDARKSLQEYYNELNSGGRLTDARLNTIATAFNRIEAAEKLAGRSGQSFFDTLISRAKQMTTNWLAMYLSMYDIIRYAKTMFSTIRELDDALVDLRKTTTMSASELNEFYLNSNNIARQMGVTTKEIIDQAAAWSRLGFSSKEQAETMAQLSSQFASISPGMDVDKAQSGLISILKAYDVNVKDVKRDILDNINVLGNQFATSNADIVDGMERTAAALHATGTSLEDSLALFVGGQEVLQNAEKMGNALRSISMRIRSYSEETGEYAEELSNISGEVVDLTKTAAHPEGISLFTDRTQEHYKSIVQYLGEISDIWDELSEKSRQDLMQKLFAKTQAQAGAAIIENFDQVRHALEAMEEAGGSADREMSVIEDSISFKLNNLKESWVGTLQSIVDRGDLGIIIDGLTGISDGLSLIIEKIGLIPSIGGLIGGAMSLQNHGLFRKDEEGNYGFAWNSFKNIKANKADGMKGFKAVFTPREIVVAKKAFEDYNMAINSGTDATEAFQNTFKDLPENFQKAAKGATNVETGLINVNAATQAVTNSTKSASLGMKALAMAGNMLLSAGIVLGINLLVTSIYQLATASQRAREEVSKLSQEYGSAEQDIDGYKEKIVELREKLDDSTLSYDESKSIREQLIGIQDELIQKYGAEKGAIDLITESIYGEVDALNDLKDVKWEKYLAQYNSPENPVDKLIELFSDEFNPDTNKRKKSRAERTAYNYTQYGTLDERDLLDFFGKKSHKIQLMGDHFQSIAESLGFTIGEGMGGNGFAAQFDGDVEETLKKLREFQDKINQEIKDGLLFADDHFVHMQLKYIQDEIADASRFEEETGPFIEQYVTNEVIAKNEEYTESLGNLKKGLEAVEEAEKNLAEVKNKSDSDEQDIKDAENAVTEAKKAYQDIYNDAVNSIDDNEEFKDQIIEQIRAIAPDLQHEIDGWDLKADLDLALDNKSDIAIKKQLELYSMGGNVDLTRRPVVSGQLMRDAGYDVGATDYATTLTSTYSNQKGDVAINFTPIFTNPETGEVKVLDPTTFQKYCEDVIAGVRADDLGLQIGAKFVGEDAIKKAEDAAEEIHKIQEQYYDYSENSLRNRIQSVIDQAGWKSEIDVEASKSNQDENWSQLSSLIDEYNLTKDELYTLLSDEFGILTEQQKAIRDRFEQGIANLSESEQNIVRNYTAKFTDEMLNGFNQATESCATLNEKLAAYSKYMETAADASVEFVSYWNQVDQTLGLDFTTDENGKFKSDEYATSLEGYKRANKKAIDEIEKEQRDAQRRLNDENNKLYMMGYQNESKEQILNPEILAQYNKKEAAEKRLEKIEQKLAKVTQNYNEKAEQAVQANMRFNASLTHLGSNLETYKKVFNDKTLKGTAAWTDMINGLTADLSGLTGYAYDSEMAEAFLKSANNMSLLESAIGGSDSALQQLQAHAKDFVLQNYDIETALNTDEFNEEYQQFAAWVATADLGTIEGQSALDTQPFINSMIALVNEGRIKAAELKAIFSDLNFKVEYTWEQSEDGKEIVADINVKPKGPGYLPPSSLPKGYTPPSGKSGSGGGGGGGGGSEPTPETFDWIETLFSRLDRRVERLKTKVSTVWDSWKKRDSALNKEIRLLEKEGKLYDQAAEKYLAEANAAELSDEYKEKVKSGALQIEEVTDENLKKQLNKYKENYDKYLTAIDNADQKHQEVMEARLSKIDNIISRAEAKIDRNDTKQSIRDSKYSAKTSEGQKYGLGVINKYYKQANKTIQANNKIAKKELKDVQAEMNSFTKEEIKRNSEQWTELTKKALDIQATIAENETKIVENKLKRVQDRVEKITSKFENKINFNTSKQSIRDTKYETLTNGTTVYSNSDVDSYYGTYASSAEKNAQLATKEVKKLKRELKRGLRSGDIKKHSDEWYDLKSRIHEAKQSIAEYNAEVANSPLNALKAKIDNITTAFDGLMGLISSKQSIIDTLYSTLTNGAHAITSGDISLYYSTVYNTAEKNADLAQQKLQMYEKELENAMSSNVIQEGSAEWFEHTQRIMDATTALTEYNAQMEEAKLNSLKERYSLIKESADFEISHLDKITQLYQTAAQITTTKGYTLTDSYYKEQKKVLQKEIKKQQKLKKDLTKTLKEGMADGTIEKNSPEWRSMVSDIEDATIAVQSLETSVTDLDKQLQQLQWDKFSRKVELWDDAKDQISDLTDYIQNEYSKLTNDNTGQLNQQGELLLAQHGVQYNAELSKLKMIQEEYNKNAKELAKDPHNETLIKRQEELGSSMRDAAKAAQQEQQAIKSMIENEYNAMKKALQDIIDKRKEQLDAEKNLYDYQKKIKDQTKNITNLEKQLAIYQGDTSEENRARIQKIKVALEEAQEERKQTEWDKRIEVEKQMMDNMSTQFDDTLQKLIDRPLSVITREAIDRINTFNNSTILSQLMAESEKMGVQIPQALESFWANPQAMLVNSNQTAATKATLMDSTLRTYVNKYNTTSTSQLDQAKKLVKELESLTSGKSTAQKEFQKAVKGTGKNNTLASIYTAIDNLSKSLPEKLDSVISAIGEISFDSGGDYSSDDDDDDDDDSGSSGSGNNGGKKKKAKNIIQEVQDLHPNAFEKVISGNVIKVQAANDIITAINKAAKKAGISVKSMNASDSGNGKISSSQAAAIQKNLNKLRNKLGFAEGGTLRKTANILGEDGIAFVRSGEEILSVDKIKQMNYVLKAFEPYIRTLDNMDSNVNNYGGNVTTGDIVISLPNVQNYEDFKSELQKDNKFRQWMTEETIGKSLNHNTLKSRRYM